LPTSFVLNKTHCSQQVKRTLRRAFTIGSHLESGEPATSNGTQHGQRGVRRTKGARWFTPSCHSRWESRVDDPAAFKNKGPDGLYHFPGFGIDALNWLLENRDITCIGVDTLSLDFGASTTFDVHLRLLGADKYGLENLANLSDIPAGGSNVYVGLIPWEEGSGGPCRVVAQW
jgi:Putative cyclase